MKKSRASFLETMVVGSFLAILIMIFVGQSLDITGNSMQPTLKNTERLIVEKITYKSRGPRRGEIVVFRSLHTKTLFLVKRVIAIPGDTIDIINGKIVINGKTIEENYLPKTGPGPGLGKLADYSTTPIPNDYFAALGDNRNESLDSRAFGLIPFENLVGKALVIYWPPANIRLI